MSRAEELAEALNAQVEIGGGDLEELSLAASELRRLDAENAQLRAELEAIYSTEPVAWTHSDFGPVELSRIQRVGWSPLIPLPVRKS